MRGGSGRRLVAAAALLLAAGGCSSSDGVLDDGTLTVGDSGSDEFSTIQAAIDSAGPGTTIEVAAGTYVERLIILQSVTLVGAGAGSIVELPGNIDPTDPVIEVRGAVNVRIEGFTVRGPSDGILVRDSSAVVIASVVASDNGDEGIDVRHSSGVEISGIFENNGDHGVQVREGSDGVTVQASTISANVQDGVNVEVSTGVTVQSSTIAGNLQDGAKIEGSADCTVRDNEVTGNGDDGVLVGESTGVQLLRNTVTGNLGFGIRLRVSPDTLLEDNTVTGNTAGNIEID